MSVVRVSRRTGLTASLSSTPSTTQSPTCRCQQAQKTAVSEQPLPMYCQHSISGRRTILLPWPCLLPVKGVHCPQKQMVLAQPECVTFPCSRCVVIQAGQGLFYSPVSKKYRALNCDSDNYGAATVTYGLNPSPCRCARRVAVASSLVCSELCRCCVTCFDTRHWHATLWDGGHALTRVTVRHNQLHRG
jgi:hypothetical protein